MTNSEKAIRCQLIHLTPLCQQLSHLETERRNHSIATESQVIKKILKQNSAPAVAKRLSHRKTFDPSPTEALMPTNPNKTDTTERKGSKTQPKVDPNIGTANIPIKANINEGIAVN